MHISSFATLANLRDPGKLVSKVNVVTDGSSKCLMAAATSTKAMPYRVKSQESLLTYCSRFSSCSVVGGTNEGVRTW